MRIVRYGPPGRERPAVLLGDGLALDIDSDPTEAGAWDVEQLKIACAAATDQDLNDISSQRLGPPIGRPGKVICVGLNYRDHVAEIGAAVPSEPVLFFKAPNTIIGANDTVLIPPGASKCDWEVELGVVVGRTARYLSSVEAAAQCIAGYTISNDVSEREFQLERSGQWMKGKSCETFNPLGPWLQLGHHDWYAGRRLWLTVNGETVQSGNTDDMIFTPSYLVWYISQFMVLEPGDLINTGTPGGVGLSRSPQKFLAPDDVIEVGIEGLGHQRQEVRRALASSKSPQISELGVPG